MDFSEALKLLKEGRKVCLKNWKHLLYLQLYKRGFWVATKKVGNNATYVSEQPIFSLPDTWLLTDSWEEYHEV